MLQIGRKIYYEKTTGNVLLDTGERSGSVVETTPEQDSETYVALSERVPETVGAIQLAYGQYTDKFGVYCYSVNTTTNELVWGELIDISNPPQIIQPTNQEIQDNLIVIMNGLTDIYMTTLGL